MVMHYSIPLNITFFSSDNFCKVIAPQPLLINTDNVKTPNLMLKMKLFWLIFHGKFEQKTKKPFFLQIQLKLQNIKQAIVLNNMFSQ